VNGAILVTPGDRIPSVPRQVLKLRIGFEPGSRLSIAVNTLVSASTHARGDENNGDTNGQVPGYAVVGLDAEYRPGSNWQIFMRVNNLTDRRYYNFGILGENFFTGPNRSFGPAAGVPPVPEQFRAPGAPVGVWVGVRYQVGTTARRDMAD
jgi:outer membrane receptor protein involved in Fe transport